MSIASRLASTLIAPLALAVLLPAAAQAMPRFGSPEAMLDRADANHDGRVSRAEFLAARAAQFDQLDRNHDGMVRLDEYPRLASSKRAGAQRLKTLISATDRNRDGQVDRGEFVSAPTLVFDRADANRDDVLDKAELAAARAELQSFKAER
jgi:hypothetical protein